MPMRLTTSHRRTRAFPSCIRCHLGTKSKNRACNFHFPRTHDPRNLIFCWPTCCRDKYLDAQYVNVIREGSTPTLTLASNIRWGKLHQVSIRWHRQHHQESRESNNKDLSTLQGKISNQSSRTPSNNGPIRPQGTIATKARKA